MPGNCPDESCIQIRNKLLLKPAYVLDEVFYGKRLSQLPTHSLLITEQRKFFLGSSDIGSFNARAKEHSLWHVPPPESHRLSDHIRPHTRVNQMCGCTQTVWTGTNYDN